MDNIMIMWVGLALYLVLFIALVVMNWRRHSEYTTEPCAEPLVNTMNATGAIETMASCGGHFLSGRNPYLSFKSGYYVAMLLGEAIAHMYWNKEIHYPWRIYDSSTGGEMDNITDNEMEVKERYFTLTIPDMQNTFVSLFLPVHRHLQFYKKWVDEDFLVLSETVQKLKDDPITAGIFKGERDE